MKMSFVVVAAVLFVLSLLSPQPSTATTPTPVPNVEVWCIWGEGGSGTGTLIRGTNGTIVLFDEGGGTPWANSCKALMDEYNITSIDYAIAGHYDTDHINGFSQLNDLLGGDSSLGVISNNIGIIYDRGGTRRHEDDAPDITESYYNLVVNPGAFNRQTMVEDGSDDIDLGSGAMLYVLSVGAEDDVDEIYIRGGYTVTDDITENNKSISLLLSVGWAGGAYGNYFDMYLGSDLEGTAECEVDDVIVDDFGRSVDVMLVDHHGSDTHYITSTEFLDTIEPEVAIISVWGNTHEHPRKNTVERLQQAVEQDDQRIIRLDPGDDTPPNDNWAPETMAYCHTTNSHVYIWTNGAHYIVDTVRRGGAGWNDITDPDLHYHPVDEGTQYPPTPLPTASPVPSKTPTPPPTATPTPTAIPTPTPGILIDEGFDNFDSGTRPAGWTFTNCNDNGDTYTSAAYVGRASPSVKLDATGDVITTTTFANPAKLRLWLKVSSSNTNYFLVEEHHDADWTTATKIENLPTTGKDIVDIPISSTADRLRFLYERPSTGNLALDDVIIHGP